MLITKVLSSNGFLAINKQLIKKIGLLETILISELCSMAEYFESQGQLEEGYFYATSSVLEDKLNLNSYKITQLIDSLIGMGLVSVIKKGVPCKRFFKLEEEKIIKLVSENQKTSSLKIKKLEFENLENKSSEISKTINKNRIIKTEEIRTDNNNPLYIPPLKSGEEKKEDKFSNPIIDSFIKQARESLNQNIYLLNEHRDKILELNRAIDDFPAACGEVFNKLKGLNFKFPDRNFKPSVRWLLKEDNFLKVLNGEFSGGKGSAPPAAEGVNTPDELWDFDEFIRQKERERKERRQQ